MGRGAGTQPGSYDELAAEYYLPTHRTSRNFDQATARFFDRNPVRWDCDGLVADAGCGRGRVHEFLAADPRKVIQLDRSYRMLRLEPREQSRQRILADAERMPLSSQSFSLVAAFLFDPFATTGFLSESMRILTPGGIFVGTLPSHLWASTLRPRIGLPVDQTRFATRDGAIVRMPSLVQPDSVLKQKFQSVGFVEICVENITLPENVVNVSPDIQSVAEALAGEVTQLPIVQVLLATKPGAANNGAQR